MNTLPRLSKVLGILLILLLLVPFVLGAAAEVAPKYINLLLPIVFLVVIAFGIVFYYISKRKRLAPTARASACPLSSENSSLPEINMNNG
jgi:predicted signal transduction protein with EAL and GGDEF domain